MEKEKISIIVPVYNAEEYINRCIKSLLAQAYHNMEILLIDDGSFDKSGRICEDFAKKDTRIKVIHTENRGVSAARNTGLDKCDGSYVSFVDADDCLTENMISYLAKLIQETGSDIAGCNYMEFAGDKVLHGGDGGQIQTEILTGNEYIEKGILSSDTRCWSKLYTRKIIGSTRFDSTLSIGEDMLFLLELAGKDMKICRSTYKGYCYFDNKGGAMNRQFKESYMDQITCWRMAQGIIEKVQPGLIAEAAAIRMISVMLAAGKLALLSGKERKANIKYAETCSQELKECFLIKGAYLKLPFGYKLKTMLYSMCPSVYLSLYHYRKHF